MRVAVCLLGCVLGSGSAVAASSDSASEASRRPSVVIVPAGAASELAGRCWARLYRSKKFAGEPLTLVGPLEVDYVRPEWGFAWDPIYESLSVGPEATLTVYDDAKFRDRSAAFKAGQSIPDLDEVMGVFRTIRSMKLTCRHS